MSATGWTLDHVLWCISWTNLQLMIADAPSYEAHNDKPKEIETSEELIEFLK